MWSMATFTQNSEESLGGLDGHGEEWTRVLSLVWKSHFTDADGQLLPRGSNQLNPVVPQGYNGQTHKC